MISYEQLVKQYDSRKEKFDNGEDVNKLELMFVGYALDAVDVVRLNFNIQLDFSEDSIKEVEKLLENLHKLYEKSKLSDDRVLDFAKQFSGYIGQVMIQNWGGEWIPESDFTIKNGPALKVKENNLFLLSKVYRRIQNGSEDNVYHFYQAIKNDIEGTNDFSVIDINQLAVKGKKS